MRSAGAKLPSCGIAEEPNAFFRNPLGWQPPEGHKVDEVPEAGKEARTERCESLEQEWLEGEKKG
jgi:hypothetical protein